MNGYLPEISLSPFVIVIAIYFILMNIVLFVLIYNSNKLYQANEKLKLMKEKMEFERSKHNDITAIWTDIRKTKHDINNHLTIINEYLENEEYEKCKGYLQKLIPLISKESLIKSDNIILDYIVNTKLSTQKEINDTDISVFGSIGDISDIDELDLASLLGNILDNATEAIKKVEGPKKIELRFFKKDNTRMIICKNTISSSVLSNNKNLTTSKEDENSHGFGISIMKNIVDKYNGMIEFFEEDNMFGVQVCFPTKQ